MSFVEEPSLQASPAAAEPASSVLSLKLRHLRRQAQLTLQQLSQRSGIAASTLSKIEHGQLSPTYEKIVALAQGLDIDVGELFTPIQAHLQRTRRSVWRPGQGVQHSTPQYSYTMLHTDLSDKRFIPLVTTIKARTRAEFPKLLQHKGEEMIYVLSGAVVLHTDAYAPQELQAGDSCYFDSSMGHACVSASDEDAHVLWVSSHLEG